MGLGYFLLTLLVTPPIRFVPRLPAPLEKGHLCLRRLSSGSFLFLGFFKQAVFELFSSGYLLPGSLRSPLTGPSRKGASWRLDNLDCSRNSLTI